MTGQARDEEEEVATVSTFIFAGKTPIAQHCEFDKNKTRVTDLRR